MYLLRAKAIAESGEIAAEKVVEFDSVAGMMYAIESLCHNARPLWVIPTEFRPVRLVFDIALPPLGCDDPGS